MKFDKAQINISSDDYFNNQDRYQNDDWAEFTPVDIFGGFVPQDKSLSNLPKNQAMIRKRFALGK